MKKTIIAILTLTTSIFSAHAQEKGFTSVGLDVSTHWSYRQTVINDPTNMDVTLSARENQSPEFQGGLALTAAYRLNSKFHIESGLSWQNYGYKYFGQRSLHTESQIDATRGIISDPLLVLKKGFARYSYVSVPVKLYWRQGDGNFRFVTNVGASVGYLTSASSVYVFQSAPTETYAINQDFNPINIMLEGGFGFHYYTDGVWGYKVENVFRYGLIPITETAVTERLYNGGAIVGVFYRLNSK